MINIIYNDDHICVCQKPINIDSEKDMPQLLSEQLGCEIYPVHRLDKAVGGLMVFAKTKQSAAKLSEMVQNRTLIKEYFCVVSGKPEKDADTLEDLLYRDAKSGKTFVVTRSRKGVKDAKLDYTLLSSKEGESGFISLIKVRLHTGRTHQIRVQFASRKLPLLGDRRYGGNKSSKNIALFSCRLAFNHPIAKKPLDFTLAPQGDYPWSEFEY